MSILVNDSILIPENIGKIKLPDLGIEISRVEVNDVIFWEGNQKIYLIENGYTNTTPNIVVKGLLTSPSEYGWYENYNNGTLFKFGNNSSDKDVLFCVIYPTIFKCHGQKLLCDGKFYYENPENGAMSAGVHLAVFDNEQNLVSYKMVADINNNEGDENLEICHSEILNGVELVLPASGEYYLGYACLGNGAAGSGARVVLELTNLYTIG